MLSAVTLAGALTASLANILAGRIGDRCRHRYGDRRRPIALGLMLTLAMLAMLGLARDPLPVAAGLIAFQLAFNLMFAPLGAVLVDHFGDHAKGRVAAMVNLAMPLAALCTGAAALLFPVDGPAPFMAVAVVVGLCVTPLVVIWPFGPTVEAGAPPALRAAALAPVWVDCARAGLARLLMQGGTAFMMSYFYLFVASRPARIGVAAARGVDPAYGALVMATTGLVLVATLMAGRWSDRRSRRRAPMIAAAFVTATGFGLLLHGGAWAVMAGYALFQIGLIAYLALDTALVAQLLRASARPGEMLGYMNLANTVPSIAVPALVLALAHGSLDAIWVPGFAAAATCCVMAAALVARVRAVA